ncbi:MAG: hypothetical protein KAI34_03690 [Candidatus Lokiarchaeota archaeon]|nr:hypothetical protein [Candidatus Lokiarchaeota archaeon]
MSEGSNEEIVEELEDIKEPVKYEPMGIKQILTEMKDISALIVDLAYSAVLFNNKELAEEVHELEEEMDKLKYQITMMAMLAARDKEDAEQLVGILQLASAAENISNAADQIVEIILRKLDVHPIIASALADADEQIFRVRVELESFVDQRTLGDLRLHSTLGTRVIAIKRGRKWIYGPNANTMISAGDLLIIRGPDDGHDRLLKIASKIPVT